MKLPKITREAIPSIFDGNVERLPRWAFGRIKYLEREIGRLHDIFEAWDARKRTRIAVNARRVNESVYYIPDHSSVEFSLGAHGYIEIMFRDGKVQIYGQGSSEDFVVEPVAANSIILSFRERKARP